MNQIIDEAYENYTQTKIIKTDSGETHISPIGHYNGMTKEQFINKCKTDSEFSERWGLKIEERELSLDDGTPIKEINIYHRLNKSVDFIECRITILPTKQQKVMSKEEIQHWINRWSKLKGPIAEAVVNIWKKHLEHRSL